MLHSLIMHLSSFVFFVAALSAFDEKTFKGSLETKCEEFLKKNRAPGLVVGVVKGSLDLEIPFKKCFYFGSAKKYPEISFKDTTTFKVGDITKTFIACLLFSLSEEGKLSLKDPANARLPKSLQVPISHQTPVSLLDLAQHTSGLPDLPLFPIKRVLATSGDIHHFFEKNGFFKKPGVYHKPSELGFAILCEALKFSGKKTLQQLLDEKFFTPLGMKNTTIVAEKSIVSSLATGYAGVMPVSEAKFDRPHSFFYPTRGGISGGEDMIKWLSFLLSVDSIPESKWLKKIFQTIFDPDDMSQRKVSFPWIISSLSNAKPFATYRVGGSHDGFYSIMAFIPETKTGVFVLTNNEYNVRVLSDQILLMLHN